MGSLLSAQDIHFGFGADTLFENVSFSVDMGAKVGLIGQNGSGKSTLLKILAGDIEAYSGTVTYAGICRAVRVEQHLPEDLHQLSLLQALLEKMSDEEKLSDGWRAEKTLVDMGFSGRQIHLQAGTLSGGEHTRLLLARALIQQPTLLLLDEPSNHMDVPSVLWLEQFLKTTDMSFVLISHDQRLLDKVTNSSWILRDKGMLYYPVSYTQAMVYLHDRDVANEKLHADQQKEIDRVTASAKRLAQWGKTYDNEKFARKAKSMQKHIDTLQSQQTTLSTVDAWSLALTGVPMQAKQIISMQNLAVRPAPTADILYTVADKTLSSGDRIAIIAPNGGGKTTLLKMLWQAFHKGTENITFHDKCQMGYYDQDLQQIDDGESIIDALVKFSGASEDRCKYALICTGFAYHKHRELVKGLSGGERARLLFIGLTLAQFHVVLLDEPTNHIDIQGKQQLAETLTHFAGAFILVSHDRTLIEASCNRFWSIENGGLNEWHDVQALYDSLIHNSQLPPKLSPKPQNQTANAGGQTPSVHTPSVHTQDEDVLLERLMELESKYQQDIQRKPKHQKPKLQQQWQQEIQQIQQILRL